LTCSHIGHDAKDVAILEVRNTGGSSQFVTKSNTYIYSNYYYKPISNDNELD